MTAVLSRLLNALIAAFALASKPFGGPYDSK